MKKIKNSYVCVEDCVYTDKVSGEKKEYKRYWLYIGGIRIKCVPSKEGLEVVNQIGIELEEDK